MSAGELWVCFRCCTTTQPRSKRRIRVDRADIGTPYNFVHLGHVGRDEAELPADRLAALRGQMVGKGGYGGSTPGCVPGSDL